MSVRYMHVFSCCDNEAVSLWQLKPDLEQTLRRWHQQDPVSRHERDRARRVARWQGNENPFVLFPGLVDRIGDF